MPPRERIGRPPLQPEQRRSRTVGVRLSNAEYAELEKRATRAGQSPATYLRLATLGPASAPRVVPVANREAWLQLSGIAADFHRLTNAVRSGQPLDDAASSLLSDLRRELFSLRMALLGKTPDGSDLDSREAPEAE